MPNIDTLSIKFSATGTKTAVNNIKEMGLAVRSLATNLNAIDGNKANMLASSLNTLKSSAPTKSQSDKVKALGDAVKGMAQSFNSVNTTKITDFTEALSNIKGVAPTKNQSERMGAFNSSLSSLAATINASNGEKLTSLASGMSLIKASIPTNKQVERLTAFSSAVTTLSEAIGSANISEFSRDMATLGDAVQTFKKSSVNSIANAATAMQKLKVEAEDTATSISQAVSKSGQSAKRGSTAPDIGISKEIIASLDKVEIKTKGVTDVLRKMGMVTPTKPFKSMEQQAEKIREKYNQVREALQKSLDGGEIKSGSPEYKKKMAELDALRNKYDELILKQKELAQSGGDFQVNPNISKAYQGMSEAIGGVKKTFGGVAGVVQTTNKYIDAFIGKIKKLGSSSTKSSRETTSLTDTVKKLGKELTRVSKMLKLMITRMALRKVIAEVGNGFQSLALHSDEFNNAMSSVINGSKQLGYSFSAMVSPLINALAPAIVYVINLLVKLLNVFNQVISSISGATSWNRAKEFTDSWRESIEGAGKSAGKTAKELKKTVLGFDQLNQLSENKDSSSGAGSNIKDMFETMPIESKWAELADKIKKIAATLFDPIKKAWEKTGEFVKSSWKYAMDEVLKLAKDVGRDFLKVWQQEKTQKIFENILESIGWIGQAIGNLAKQFREAWNYNDIGLKIFEAIRDIILIITEHIKNMAKATAEWADSLDFKPLLTSIQGWLESIQPAVDAVMGILEDFYTKVVLKFTKWVVESGLPALIDVFKRFNDEVDWDLLRERLEKLWEHLEPFMETVGEGLIIFIERVTTALAEFINGDEFADFLERLEKWMDSVTPEDVADGIEKLVKALVAFKVAGLAISALSGVAGIISGIATAFSGLGTVASGVGSFATAVGGMGAALAPIVAIASSVIVVVYSLTQSFGGLEGTSTRLKDGLSQMGDMFKKVADNLHLSDKLEELKKAISDILDELGDMKDYWNVILTVMGAVATLIGSVLLATFKTLISVISSLATFIKGTVEVLSGFGKLLVGIFTGNKDKIVQGAKDIWNGIYDTFKGGIEALMRLVVGLVEIIVQPFRTIKYMLIGDPIVIDMWEGIKKVFEDAIKAVGDFVVGLKDKIVEIFSSIKSSIDEKVAVIKDKLSDWSNAFKDVKEKVSNYMNEVKDNASKRFEDLKTNVSSFKDKWSESWSQAKTKLEDFKRDGLGILSTIKDAMSKDKWTFSGVADGLKKTFQDAKDGIKGIWNSIAEKLNGEHDVGGSSFHINLPIFARGGFPEDGLFMANHHELVGSFSNGKTAVANNQQIIAGIEQGVYNAVSRANSQNSGSASYIANEIIVDGEVLARSVTKAQEKQNRRFSPSMA